MPAYLVQLPAGSGFTKKDGADTVVVFAEDETDAKAMAKARYTGDSDAAWGAADVTEIAAGTELEGYRLHLVMKDDAGDPFADITVTGQDTDDIEDMVGDMVTALNAVEGIAGAAYSTGDFTVAETTDGIGDYTFTLELLGPVSMSGSDNAPIPSFIGTITDGGDSGDALSAVIDNTAALPAVYGAFKS